jgi:hypothetical protein
MKKLIVHSSFFIFWVVFPILLNYINGTTNITKDIFILFGYSVISSVIFHIQNKKKDIGTAWKQAFVWPFVMLYYAFLFLMKLLNVTNFILAKINLVLKKGNASLAESNKKQGRDNIVRASEKVEDIEFELELLEKRYKETLDLPESSLKSSTLTVIEDRRKKMLSEIGQREDRIDFQKKQQKYLEER